MEGSGSMMRQFAWSQNEPKDSNGKMNRLIKVIGLIFLPVAAILFVLALLSGRDGKTGKNFFIQEYDDQNIYG